MNSRKNVCYRRMVLGLFTLIFMMLSGLKEQNAQASGSIVLRAGESATMCSSDSIYLVAETDSEAYSYEWKINGKACGSGNAYAKKLTKQITINELSESENYYKIECIIEDINKGEKDTHNTFEIYYAGNIRYMIGGMSNRPWEPFGVGTQISPWLDEIDESFSISNQWYKYDFASYSFVALEGETSKSITPSEAGIYKSVLSYSRELVVDGKKIPCSGSVEEIVGVYGYNGKDSLNIVKYSDYGDASYSTVNLPRGAELVVEMPQGEAGGSCIYEWIIPEMLAINQNKPIRQFTRDNSIRIGESDSGWYYCYRYYPDGSCDYLELRLSRTGTHEHSYKIVKKLDATYEKEGCTWYSCEGCDKEYEKVIPKLALQAPKIKTIKNVKSGISISFGEVKGAKSYIIYRKAGKTGKWTKIKTLTDAKKAFVNTSLDSGTDYSYKIIAACPNNTSKASDVKSIRRLSQVNLKLTLKNKKPKLSWKKVKGAAGYIIYKKNSKNKWVKLDDIKAKKATETYIDKAVKPGRKYKYTVQAYYKTSKSSYNTVGVAITVK